MPAAATKRKRASKAAWQSCPPPKTALQKLKYVKVCSDHLSKCMATERKQANTELRCQVLPAVLYKRNWQTELTVDRAAPVVIQNRALSDWGYHSCVSIVCANCQVSLRSDKLPRYSMFCFHAAKSIYPFCSKCGRANWALNYCV